MKRIIVAVFLLSVAALAQQPKFSPEVQQFIGVEAPVVALEHVKVVDGTGAAPQDDQTIVVENGKIASIGPAASARVPGGAKALDLHGYAVIPGLVGMHNHFYDTAWLNLEGDKIAGPGLLVTEIPFSAPRLYLAAGVTTMRTTGNVEGFTDFEVKRRVDAGQMPGPHIDATAPYLEGPGAIFGQMHQLSGPDDARRMVDFWADEGATSFKAYMNITHDELAAAVAEAHKRGFKLTGHLCSVTWPDAIATGIDNFEHGPVFTDTEFVADKQPDKCPQGAAGPKSWGSLDVNGSQVQGLIKNLIEHRVAVTSTLPVFAASLIDQPPSSRVLEAMAVTQRESFLKARAGVTSKLNELREQLVKKEMGFEYAFAKAGGLLLAGPDPTGNGGTLPGFGDWRELELLVQVGFTPAEAIHIATENGAKYMGRDNQIGTIAAGKNADLVVIKGDPTANINDIEKVETVFKDGVGYDSQKLIDSVRGTVGVR